MTHVEVPVGWLVPEWTIGDRLRKARRIAGLTQAEAAGQCGVAPEAWSKWEGNGSIPRDPVKVALALERATRVPAWWVLGLPQPGPVSATGR